jgi:predicted DNA-binding transcriptional regulator AlpA
MPHLRKPETTEKLAVLSLAQLCEIFGVRKPTIIRWIRLGQFPQASIRLNRRYHRWLAADIERFIHESKLPNEGE